MAKKKTPTPKMIDHVLTEQDFIDNPELKDQDLKVGDTIQIPVTDEYSEELHEQMKPYLEAYPTEKKFLVTSDGQVFLSANEQDAKTHQSTLDKEIELVVYAVSE